MTSTRPMAHGIGALAVAFVLALTLSLLDGCSPQPPLPPASPDASAEGEGEGEEGEGVAGEGEGEGVAGEGEGEGDLGEGEGEGSVGTCTQTAVPACSGDGDGDFSCTLAHDGLERTYDLHIPPTMPARPSIVFAFHGLRTNAALQRYISNMNEASDAEGYVVVYPEGTGPSTEQAWNAGICCAQASANDVDDVGFTLAMLEHLRGALCIDEDRVYATGLSNGGHMSYRLACEASDVFAAVASVAGVTTVSPCNPSRPVPVLHFHGTSDAIVSYSAGIDGHGAEDTVATWAERNGCSTEAEVTYAEGEVTCRAFTECDEGSAAELCTVSGGGHTWPGGEDVVILGHTTADISATEYMGAFFAAHPMP